MRSILLISISLAAACGGQSDFVRDPFSHEGQSLFGDKEDQLSSPYVVGASFDVELVGFGDAATDAALRSTDESIIRVGPTRGTVNDEGDVTLLATVDIVAPGTVDLEVLRNGRVRREIVVVAALPDRVALRPLPEILVVDYRAQQGTSESGIPETGEPVVLIDQPVDFELWPLADETLLMGSAGPTTSTAAGLLAEAGSYRLDHSQDVVTLTASAVGDHALTVSYGTTSFNYTIVGGDQIDRLYVDCPDRASDDVTEDSVFCLARASFENVPVYGVLAEWSLDDGTVLTPDGDLIRFDDSATQMTVHAAVPGNLAEVVTRGDPSTVAVLRSNEVTGCSHVSRGALWLALPGLFLLGLRRRERTLS